MNRRGFIAVLLGAPIAAKMKHRVTGVDLGREPAITDYTAFRTYKDGGFTFWSTDGRWVKYGSSPWRLVGR